MAVSVAVVTGKCFLTLLSSFLTLNIFLCRPAHHHSACCCAASVHISTTPAPPQKTVISPRPVHYTSALHIARLRSPSRTISVVLACISTMRAPRF